MREVYQSVDPAISTTVTVPILYDKKLHRIVNNESSQIIRIFNESFNSLTGDENDYYPEKHRAEIDQVNALVYDNINNGVYKTGFSKKSGSLRKVAQNYFRR